MQIKSICHLFVYLSALSLLACTSDEMALTVGEGVINDNHKAYYTENFTMFSETKLAEYVTTNNTGIALCGSYSDDYIGEITTNTVFKISPNVNTANSIFDITNTYDSIKLVMLPNGYVYGDSTKTVNLTLHKLTENYTLLDTINSIDGTSYLSNQKTNYSTTSFDPTVLAHISFIPEDIDGDSIMVKLPDDMGKEWFENIIKGHDDYTIGTGETDEKFVRNVLNGLTIRSVDGNSAVVGFDMPTSTVTRTPGITIRIYYHTTGPYAEKFHDFSIYQPSYQYNQITADFSTGVLKGITPGGDGIPSTETNGLTFIQSGLGLMTNIEIPTLHKLYKFGADLTVINMNLDFAALPRSFNDSHPLPLAFTMNLLQKNGQIINSGVLDFFDQPVSISQTGLNMTEAGYSVPITRYAWDEQDLLGSEAPDHNTLLLTARYNGAFIPNINRMVIGDANNKDCKMKVKMYYTIFE